MDSSRETAEEDTIILPASRRLELEMAEAMTLQKIRKARNMCLVPTTTTTQVEEIDFDDECVSTYCDLRTVSTHGEPDSSEEIEIDDINPDFQDVDEDEKIENEERSAFFPFAYKRGPVKEELMRDKSNRQKSFYRRKLTMLKQARQLAVICNARVKLEITAESGNSYCFESHPVETRDVRLQVGSSFLSKRPAPKTTLYQPCTLTQKPALKPLPVTSPTKRRCSGTDIVETATTPGQNGEAAKSLFRLTKRRRNPL